MKALVLTCNTGEGHNSSARAILEAFTAQGAACDIVDSLSLISEKASAFISNWHTRIYRHMPQVFKTGYSYTERHPLFLNNELWDGPYIAAGVDRLQDLLLSGGYDRVVCVHAFASTLLAKARRKYGAGCPACFVATDYTCSPTVAQSRMDLYFIPHEGLMDEFAAAGIPRHKLVPTGIPLRAGFYEREEKQAAKALLGLPMGKPNVLLMCGSMGCGPMEELALALSHRLGGEVVLSVACGTNEKLLRALEKREQENMRLFGYTDKVPLLMDSAELFLTKPGGISISEAGAKGLPLLLIDAVGGCEGRNLSYFTDRGWARTAIGPEPIAALCLDMLGSRNELGRQSAALREAFGTNAAQAIYHSLAAQTALYEGSGRQASAL